MGQIKRALKEDLDKILTNGLFIAFGISALFIRPGSQSTQESLVAVIFDGQFILIGVLLMLGTIIGSYRIRVLGFILYTICLSTLALLTMIVGHSVVSLLLLAFALRGYSSIREMKINRRFIAELGHALERPGDVSGNR